MLLRKAECQWCYRIFHVCRRCWRGQTYCSKECSIAGARQSHRKAQKKYRETEEGQKAHREAERRRRIRKIKKTVDDGTSTPPINRYTISSLYRQTNAGVHNLHFKALRGRKKVCHYCGRSGVVVKKFPRRGYGTENYERHIGKMRC